MQAVLDKNETGTTVVIDDKNFINCFFRNCTLHYSGGDFAWTDTQFENCPVKLSGAAERTSTLMAFLGIKPTAAGAPGQ